MKTAIIALLFLFIGCSRNPLTPPGHDFYSGDIYGDFGILIKTTGYYDIGDGAEIEAIVGMKIALTIKDKRPKSIREANPIKTIGYRKNGSLLLDTGKQALLFFDEGKTEIAVEIITANSSSTINASIFGMERAIPKPLEVGNFMRGVLASDVSIQEELVLLDEYLAIDSAGWVTSTVSRLATGFWFVDWHNVKGVSENGVSKRMFEFINSNIDSARYGGAIFWAYLAIMYAGVVNPDSVEAFYLRYIIESPRFRYAEDNRQSFGLLEQRDYGEFLDLISDIISNPSAYADKDSLSYLLEDRDADYVGSSSAKGYESLFDIAKEKSDSLSQ